MLQTVMTGFGFNEIFGFLLIDEKRKTRGIQERLLRTTDTPVQCLQAAPVSPGVGVVYLRGRVEPACKPFEQRKCCACNRELFDICVNCHNKAGVLETSHMKFVCLALL